MEPAAAAAGLSTRLCARPVQSPGRGPAAKLGVVLIALSAGARRGCSLLGATHEAPVLLFGKERSVRRLDSDLLTPG